MKNKDFLELVKNYKPTEEEIKKHWESIIEMNKKFAEQERRSRITQEWLNRPFSSL